MNTTLAASLLAALTADPEVARQLTTPELRELLPQAEGTAREVVTATLAAREPEAPTDQGFVYTGELAREVALEQGLSPRMAKAILSVQLHI